MKRIILSCILICSMVLVATGCRDDFMASEFTIGKGHAKVSATLDFKPMSPALTRTRATGNALKDINSLHVLLYDYKTKELKNSWQIEKYTVSDEERTDTDAENGTSAEAMTKRASFELSEEINFGQYYMYAVANISDLLTNTDYTEAIKTVDGLKSLSLTWNDTDISKNSQMMGYFTNSSATSGDESLVLNEKSVKLHAWLRRAASKVTVAFDGSGLKEGVFVYLQSVQIKDIPYQCYLGKDNNVGAEGYDLKVYPDDSEEPKQMLDGEVILYHTSDTPDDFEYGEACADHRITVGTPHYPREEKERHGENTAALYFYENMQGEGASKLQDANGDGKLDHPGLPGDATYRPKDNKPYGTYIEVKAHYVSTNKEHIGNGPIVYRFMLGQDVKKDYNAKRNCHYKLTLRLKNFANDADWHIEYKQPKPSITVPDPYYISYLYNHSMMYPLKVNTGGREIEYLEAEIVDNRWAPHNASTGKEVYWTDMDIPYQNQWHGFLSLHKTTQTVLSGDNKTLYETSPKRGFRKYETFEEGEHTTGDQALPNDKYRVEKYKTGDDVFYNIYLPMYTRAKQMVVSTGYTGNNPYVAYQRKAEVKITAKLKDLDELLVDTATIYQVRRVVNPKGIYRSVDNNKPFHVMLKQLPMENAENFETFQSEGPWKAYVVKEDNGKEITLSRAGESVEIVDPDYGNAVSGKTGSLIEFNVNFAPGTPGKNRYAIIRVEYHNYTCQHLIFVRQGDEPDNLIDNGARWYAKNMKTKSELASTPLDEGSLFKFGNWDAPIDALNNKNPREPWTYIKEADFVLHPKDGFTIAGSNEIKTWGSITSKESTEYFEDPISGMRVAEDKDYRALLNSDDIEQGYGVLYGDDATETADHINDVYGYDYEHNKEGRGMRGCFVYNKETGKNLFFPIGASGYGHRKDSEAGILRYSAGRTGYYPSPGVNDRPLFYDLFRRPGAAYWYKQQEGTELAWDINYFTFDFNNLSISSSGKGADACFVRCVVK
ncbi:hypothetical protein [uncultured Bacteroides sp.]|uniref:hypothetical protein n=1 Tax=uncultured Bacteroides sp. TaxID=162156 RepID=UPI0025E56D14|nr:hypothetical protein [uncultured Bacteroides sp.]